MFQTSIIMCILCYDKPCIALSKNKIDDCKQSIAEFLVSLSYLHVWNQFFKSNDLYSLGMRAAATSDNFPSGTNEVFWFWCIAITGPPGASLYQN